MEKCVLASGPPFCDRKIKDREKREVQKLKGTISEQFKH